MRHSIKFKMIGITTLLLLSSILICWFVNKQFLEDYYKNYKVENAGDVETQVEELVEQYLYYNETSNAFTYTEDDYDSFDLAMRQLEVNNSVSIYIMRQQYNTGPSLFWPKYNAMQADRVINSASELYKDLYVLSDTDNEPGGKHSDFELLKQTDYYAIAKVSDKFTEAQYIDLLGALNDNYLIYIRTNFAGVSESAMISNQFLGYVGFFVILIGSIIMYFVSRTFTRPIYKLSSIAYRMSNLDFSEKYIGKSKDEIAILGNSINEMSWQLEQTISNLKRANNELQRDIKNKIEIDEMRKEFLSNVTHELKTPIALIQGYAEGLRENISDDQESRDFYCEVIIDEASKMNTMVKKLLTLNQLESSNNMVEFDHFNLTDVIQSVINSYGIKAQEVGANIIFEESDSLYVWADEYMIEEVITNYITNAFNHLKDPKEIRIRIQKGEGMARVSVFNTGDLIPDEDIDNIWTKFYKVDKARTREYGGNGIGLSIVKAIMNAHNKNFGVINRENGVEFYFDIDTKN